MRLPFSKLLVLCTWTFGIGAETETKKRTPRAIDHASKYPHPDLALPHPSLTLDFRMSVTLNPKISVGATPFGHRNWISFTGGSWSGSWGSGIVLVLPPPPPPIFPSSIRPGNQPHYSDISRSQEVKIASWCSRTGLRISKQTTSSKPTMIPLLTS